MTYQRIEKYDGCGIRLMKKGFFISIFFAWTCACFSEGKATATFEFTNVKLSSKKFIEIKDGDIILLKNISRYGALKIWGQKPSVTEEGLPHVKYSWWYSTNGLGKLEGAGVVKGTGVLYESQGVLRFNNIPMFVYWRGDQKGAGRILLGKDEGKHPSSSLKMCATKKESLVGIDASSEEFNYIYVGNIIGRVLGPVRAVKKDNEKGSGRAK